MSSIRRIGDKKYRLVYDIQPENGKRKQKTETLVDVTKRAAERIYSERLKTARDTRSATSHCSTMNLLFDRYIESRSIHGLASSTLQRYKGLIEVYLCPQLGDMIPAEVKAHAILSACEAWSKRKTTARTRRHAYDLLRAILNYAVTRDIIETNPTDKISNDDLPKAKKPQLTVLNTVELALLMQTAMNPSNRSKSRGYIGAYSSFGPAIAFAAQTGARRGETLGLRWSDLDLDARSVRIVHSLAEISNQLHFKEPKNGRSRTISMPPRLTEVLRAHRERQAKDRTLLGSAYNDDDLVFCKPDGSALRPSHFGAAFTELVRRAGVTRIRLHDLRHTHASLLAKEGVPIQVVSSRLGHSGIGVTVDRYISMYREQDDTAAMAFEKLLG